jgi:predicted acyltransferase
VGAAEPQQSAERSAAIDLVRGAAVAAMIFVNNPGDWAHVAPPFAHADWHGWTPTDLIFPTFLFALGSSAVYSVERRRAAGASPGNLGFHAAARGAILVALGWALALFPFGLVKLLQGDFAHDPSGALHGWWTHLAQQFRYLRIPGVLPRIGVVATLTAWILIEVRRPAALFVVIALLLGFHGYLLAGRGFPLTPEDNIQKLVDDSFLAGHLYTREDTDPEGIVSTLSALATALLGALAGMALRAPRPPARRAGLLVAAGILGITAGLALDAAIPINKKLWTPSFAVLTAGFASAFLGLAAYATEVRGWRRPLGWCLALGRNPLFAFVLSTAVAILLARIRIGHGAEAVSLQGLLYRQLSWIGDPTLRSHIYAAAFLVAILGAAGALSRRGWYWKI